MITHPYIHTPKTSKFAKSFFSWIDVTDIRTTGYIKNIPCGIMRNPDNNCIKFQFNHFNDYTFFNRQLDFSSQPEVANENFKWTTQ